MDETKPAPTHCSILISVATSFHTAGAAEAGMELTISSSLLKGSVPSVPVSRWALVTSAPPRAAPRVTRAGSPPKLLMLCCTHLRAASWSQRPAFPLASAEPGVGNKIWQKRKLQTYKFGINVTFFAALVEETCQNWYQSLKVWSFPRQSLYTVTPFQFCHSTGQPWGCCFCPKWQKNNTWTSKLH